jgi:peptide-methionine (S)-S-oxide reductase
MSLIDRLTSKFKLPEAALALPGRDKELPTASHHFINGNPLKDPYPKNMQSIIFGLGCFWGAERIFWSLPGVYVTAVGYSAGITKNPTYQEVCTGLTGHNEVVLVVFDPEAISLDKLLQIFWESHDPTQGMRQGNDRGTQYRSGIYTIASKHKSIAAESMKSYQRALSEAGRDTITTEVVEASEFYFAEEYHQQYLAKNPDGYCGIGGTGIACPVNSSVPAE